MTVRTPIKGRPTTVAAIASTDTPDWRVQGACREEDPDLFFEGGKRRQSRARKVCAGCPVLARCLTQTLARDDSTYRWGTGGGLNAVQRRALSAELLLGNRPNLAVAELLLSPMWASVFRGLRNRCRSLGEIVAALREHGLLVDEVTVRVAVWWAGGDGSRVAKPADGDTRAFGTRVREDHADEIRRLRAEGAWHLTVAAYLGAPMDPVSRAVAAIEQADAVAKENLGVAA